MNMTTKESEEGLKRLGVVMQANKDNELGRFRRFSPFCKHRKRIKGELRHACKHTDHSEGVQTARERAILFYCMLCNCPIVNH